MMSRLFTAAAAIVFAAASYGQQVGAVKVRVILKSGTVKGLLRDVPAAEREAALAIVRQIGLLGEMSFVRWLPEQSAAEAEARLTVTLSDQKPVRDLPADHYVSYEAEILAPEGKDVHPLLNDYGRGVKIFTKREEQKKLGKPKDLAEALGEIVKEQLHSRREHFYATFLYKVPLTRLKPTLEDEGTVVVALPWNDLGAKEESELAIDIAATPPAQRQNEKGRIVLGDLLECPKPNCTQPSTRGKAMKFNCHGIGDVPPKQWSEIVNTVRDALKTHVVYMKAFVPSYNGTTVAGVFPDFGDGSQQ